MAADLFNLRWMTPAFFVLNLLNLGDALLTHVALTTGAALEGNPVVRAIGLPGKVIMVLGVSLLISRLRPRALWAPVPALAAVVLYSSVNLFVL